MAKKRVRDAKVKKQPVVAERKDEAQSVTSGTTVEGTEISVPIPHLENETVLPATDEEQQ